MVTAGNRGDENSVSMKVTQILVHGDFFADIMMLCYERSYLQIIGKYLQMRCYHGK